MFNTWIKEQCSLIYKEREEVLKDSDTENFIKIHKDHFSRLQSDLDYLKHKLIGIEQSLQNLQKSHECYDRLYRKLIDKHLSD